VRAGDAEVQNLLVNLLLNAIQASQPEGKVGISAHAGDGVRVCVIDDGCGIPAEYRKQIFEPFFSLREGGTGLGLAIARDIARSHGGDISLADSPLGGLRATVRVPV